MIDKNKLEFHSGHESLDKDRFVELVSPYLQDLRSKNRTNYLCVFVYGDGSKADVTGYKSSTTLNVTNNSRVIRCQKTGGSWAVYKLND